MQHYKPTAATLATIQQTKRKRKDMKKILSILSAVALAATVLSSCVSTKKIVYFQGADSLFQEAQKIAQQYEMRLKPADQVLVKVTCSNPELLTIFSQDVVMGTSGTTSMSNMGNGTMSNAYGYTVNNKGDIILPAIGAVKAEGLTVDEFATAIENKIKEKGLVGDPEVTVRLLNARVTVVGAVQTPKVVNLSSERNTIIDVISQCSDVDDTGLRYKLKLFREENGQISMYDLDLTKADIFKSPAYYVQQNDMIYVEPNKSKRIKSSPFYTSLGAWSSILAIASTAVSLVILITK